MRCEAHEQWPINRLTSLEFGQIAAGPFVGMLLADLGRMS